MDSPSSNVSRILRQGGTYTQGDATEEEVGGWAGVSAKMLANHRKLRKRGLDQFWTRRAVEGTTLLRA